MKRTTWITIVTVLLMTFTTSFPSTVLAKAAFNDIAGHWAEGEIEAAVNYGYISGYPDDGTFRPEVSITRAEFVKIINYARNYTEVSSIPFTDVPVNEWYYIEIQKAYSAGYIQGDEDGKFRPTANISRQEVAVILERFTEGGNGDFDISHMRDAGSIASWALNGVKKAFSMGYVSGDDQAMFNPTNPLKRCEAVKIINRVLGLEAVYISGNESSSNNGGGTTNSNVTDPNAISITNFRTTEIGIDEVRITVTSNKDGIVYWVLMPDSNISTPSVEQVINGRTSNGSAAYRSGDIVVYSGVAKSERIYNIEPEESYKMCVVAMESNGTRSAVSTITFNSKSEGDTGEEWINTFKVVSGSVSSTAAEFTFTSSRVGTLYWVLVYDNSSTPSQANIRNGYNSSGSRAIDYGEVTVSARSTSYTFEVPDLEPSTVYRVYACVYDNSDDYSVVRNEKFTTSSSSTSNWLSSITTPSGSNLTSDTAYATANFNVYASSYRFYWMLVESAARAPSASEIRDHTYTTSSQNDYRVDWPNSAITPPTSSSVNAGKYIIELKALTPGKSYRVYGVIYSGSSYSTVRNTSTFTTPTSSVSYAANLTGMSVQYDDSGAWKDASGFNFTGATRNYTISTPASNKVKISVTPASGTTARMAGSTGVTVTSTGTNEWELTKPTSASSFTATVTVEQSGRTSVDYTLTINVEAKAKAKLDNVYFTTSGENWFNSNTYEYIGGQSLSAVSGPAFQLTIVPETGANVVSVDSTGGATDVISGSRYSIPMVTGIGATRVTIEVAKEGADNGIYIIDVGKTEE